MGRQSCRLGRGPTSTAIACPSGGRWHRPPVALAQSRVPSPARYRPKYQPRPPLGLRGHPGSRSPGAGLLERGAYGRHEIREAGSDWNIVELTLLSQLNTTDSTLYT